MDNPIYYKFMYTKEHKCKYLFFNNNLCIPLYLLTFFSLTLNKNHEK